MSYSLRSRATRKKRSQMKKTKEKTIPFPPPQISFKEMAVERMMSSPGARSWFHRLISFFGCQPVELSSPFERLPLASSSFSARANKEKNVAAEPGLSARQIEEGTISTQSLLTGS